VVFLSKKALKRKLGTALIYSPFLRLLLFNTWFQLAFGAAFCVTLLTTLMLPKIWKASPEEFLPVVKVSALDKAQNWSLKRSARKFAAARDFKRASQSWEAAVAQNPADAEALRGFLANTLDLDKSDQRIFRSALSQMNWLLRLTGTNTADVTLTAKICEKFKWNDVAVYYLGNIHEPLPPEAEAIYLKALFHQRRMSEFLPRFEKTAADLNDKELPLYALCLRASGNGPGAMEAERELARAAQGGAHAQLATRLHMLAAGEKGNVDAYERDLQALGLRNEETVTDHATYWLMLKAHDRVGEAIERAKAFTRAPPNPAETVRLADAYFQLGMTEACRELLKKTSRAFAQAPEVWLAYAALLEHMGDWAEMRAIALQIREESGSRETLWGYGYLLEGRAELAQERPHSAERAFKKAVECRYEIPPLGLAVAKKLAELKYAALGLRLLQKLESTFENDLVFWENYFEAAFAIHDAEGVLKASERCYALNSRDVNAHNRYAAALLVNRSKPEEVIQLTVQLVAKFPQSLAAKINHSFALLMNQRTAEALELLQSIPAGALSPMEASDYHLARFEAYYNLGRWEEAEEASEKIGVGTLFPPQRKWLAEKRQQISAQKVSRNT
jgi:tetratricopeptide (TPR) repeat protein